MDNKRLMTAMVVGLVLMLGWLTLVQYLDKANPHWNLMGRPTTQPKAVPATLATPPAPLLVQPAPTTAPTPTTVSPAAPAAPAANTAPNATISTQPSTGTLTVKGGPSTEVVILGSLTPNDPNFAMGLEIDPRGAGVNRVTLNAYKRTVSGPDRYSFQTPATDVNGFGAPIDASALFDATRVLATRTAIVDGMPVNLASLLWKVESSSNTSATFVADITRDGGAVVRISTTYTLLPKSDPSMGYEVLVVYGIANVGSAAVTAELVINGPGTPPYEIERGPERQVVHGYLNTTRGEVDVRHTMAESLTKDNQTLDITKDGASPHFLGWFGGSGAYFNAILRPEPLPGSPTGSVVAEWVRKVEARVYNPMQIDTHLREIFTSLETTPIRLEPGQSVSLPTRVYFGPKKRDVLKTPHYSAFPLSYDLTLVMTTWLCSFCTFQWLIGVLVAMLNFFHGIVRDWGLAIILLVVVVRLLLHPITRKSQENMMKMGKMGPEIERLKKKYGDDKEGLNKAMMGFYKEQGATPILGCLPMFLQMPIWIALYAALQSTFELRQAPFLFGLTWITDLSKPDHLWNFGTFMLFGIFPFSGLNLIPFLLAIVFYLQFKYTPKPPIQTPEQIQQQKMMQWMTPLFPIFLYNMPAGLNIYILTSTTFGIIENKLIRDALKRKDLAAGTGPVIVDEPAPSSGGSPGRKKIKSTVKPVEPKKKGLMGWLEDMQQKAEEIRNQQNKKKG